MSAFNIMSVSLAFSLPLPVLVMATVCPYLTLYMNRLSILLKMHAYLTCCPFFSLKRPFEALLGLVFSAMHSANSKERPSSSSCCRTLAAGKSSILERNNNNNDILSTAFHSSLKQDSTRVSQKTDSKDPAKFDSLPPSGVARTVNKNSIVRTGNDVKEKTANRQDRSSALSSVDIKTSGPLTSAEPGRRVSSGVEMMSRFAPRPYRPASADSKVVRTRSQSVEVHTLSGSRSGLITGLEGQSSPRGRLGTVADDSKVGQLVRNYSPADIKETPKTSAALSSSACSMSSNKLPGAKVSSSPAPSHSAASTTATAVTRQTKDVPLVNHVIQHANSLPHGSQGKGETLVKSNAKVPTTTTTTMNSVNRERTTAGITLVSGTKSSEVTSSSSAKSGGFTTSTARHSHSLPPQQTTSQTVTAVSLKATASLPSKMTNDKKTSSSLSSSAGSSGTFSTIPRSAATTSSNDTTRTITVHLSPAVSCKESSSGQTMKSNDALLKGHPRDASLVPSESPTKPSTASNDKGTGSVLTGGSNGSVKHRAVIKSGPESLLYSNSCPGPMASQKSPKDGVSTLGDGASVKTSVALENATAPASRFTSSVSSSATSIVSESSSSSNKTKTGDETNSSVVPLKSTQSNSAASSKSSMSSSSTTLLNNIGNSTLTSLSPISSDYQNTSPESPISPTDSLIVLDSPVSQPPDLQRKLNTPTGLRLSTKIDTSNDSVSSALSVLMKRQSASGNMVPASPKCSYRYGSRGAISSIYQNKLGSGASNQYNKNMSDLYGDFFRNMKDCRSLAKDTIAPALEVRSQQDPTSTSKTFPAELESGKTIEIRPSAKDDSSLPVTHSDQVSLNLYLCPTERRSRCNAPQPIRRVLSCDSASPPIRGRSPLLASETRRLFFEGASDATLKPDDAQLNGIDRSPSPNAPYDPPLDSQTSFIDDPGADCASEAGIVSGFAAVRETPRRSKRKQRVSFEPVSLLLNAALEGELDLVKVTIPKVRSVNL